MTARIFSTGLYGLCAALLALGVGGCASNNVIDFGRAHDMAVGGTDDLGTGDLAVGDLSGTDGPTGDGGTLSGCVQIATWPNDKTVAGYDDSAGVTYVAGLRQSGTTTDVLEIDDYHAQGETFPGTVNYTTASTIQNSDVVLTVCGGFDQSSGSCAHSYFVQGGSLTINQADQNVTVGRMKVSGTNLKLVEWQDPMQAADGGVSGDKPLPNGQCLEVGSLSFDTTWDNADGGTPAADGGTPTTDGGTTTCHAVVNEVQTAGAAGASDEFVEIYNPCAAAVDLSGGKLVYRSAAGASDVSLFSFPASTTLASGAYLLYGGSAYPGAKDGALGGGLAAAGGGVGLRDSASQLLDSVGYGSATNAFVETKAAPAPASGQSISRIPNGTDTNDNSKDFQITATPTPKAANK